MNYEYENVPLILLFEQDGAAFGIPLNGMNCQCQRNSVSQVFTEAAMDKEFFRREENIVRLDGGNTSE